ncbi:MAG: hypothetical protein BWY75_00024 [bacterium ADurb.Bin425]|nr:MAG: hypothetical protein BWY75_00024 [bacterium ADurb.Bin425]
MPVSWNEIRNNAMRFSKEWAHAKDERAESQTFWNEFFSIFGISRKRVASYENAVKKYGGKQGYVDLFWPGMLLIEHKSRGRNLDRAFQQAFDYFPGIKERDLPRYIFVSDFAKLRVYDLEQDDVLEFPISELHKHIKRFGFIAGYQTQQIAPQNPVNIKAAEKMGAIHDLLKASGYQGHQLEMLLVRLLFCLFADMTGIFQPAQSWRLWIEERTADDGSDLGAQLTDFFEILNTEESKRSKLLDEQLAAFPYVNGRLFQEALPVPHFDKKLREMLLDCCTLNWSAISPAIFGAMFQSIMDHKARRNLGAHYTSEENILKVIKPLFLDDLWDEFNQFRSNKKRLLELQKKLGKLRFFDPACGCGNFLVITYREIRKLELEILRAAARAELQMTVDVGILLEVDVDQFYGIEIEEFPAQIAQVALWLTDHQMNTLVSQEFGLYLARIPLKKSPHIHNANALRLDWASVIRPEECDFVFGNPPFVGAKYMNDLQRNDAQFVFTDIRNGGLLDFVAAWYVKAANYISTSSGKLPRCAFVSTSSITQGEQVGILWSWLLGQGYKISFGHRTFQWTNEASGKAAVHCVIIGFEKGTPKKRTIFEYDDLRGEPQAIEAKNINPYLIDADDIVLSRRSEPLCAVPRLAIGNKPVDDGNYLFTTEEKAAFVKAEKHAAPLFRRWIGTDELLYGYERWCLYLKNCPPNQLQKMPNVLLRIEAVRKFRKESKSKPTQKLADFPTQFHVENIPSERFLVVAKVSSEKRYYIPIAFEDPPTMASDLLFIMREASLFHFGILASTMHNSWVHYTCGRLESRYRYSAKIVYNNFPFPQNVSAKQIESVEKAAQHVLDVRSAFPESNLSDLYDPNTMPSDLVKAHQLLDKAVDAAYGRRTFKKDGERVAFLFDLYKQLGGQPKNKFKPRK